MLRLKEAQEDKDILIQKVAQLECLEQINQAEINRLAETVNILEPCAVQFQCLQDTSQAEINHLNEELNKRKLYLNQAHQDKDELRQKVARLEHNDKILQTKIINLLATVQDCEERENSLTKQNKTISDELARLESHTDKMQAEDNNLWAEIQDLQEKENILTEKNQSLSDEVALLESLKEKHQVKIEHLSEEVHDLQRRVREAQYVCKDKDEEISLQNRTNDKYLTEINKLRLALHGSQENEVFLKEQNESVTEKLAPLESLTVKQNEKIENLKKDLQALQYQVKDAEQSIFMKDEIITKQSHNLAYKNEDLEEINNLISNFKQTISDLEEQLETKQEDGILAGVENFQEEYRIGAKDKDSPDEQSNENLPEATLEEQSGEDPCRTTPEEKNDEIILGTPAAQAETRSWWGRCTKGTLKACWHVGLITGVMVIATMGVLTSTGNANCNAHCNCNLWDYVHSLLQPTCNGLPRLPYPF
ncbi:ERC protein 2 [Etheostoma spectabile]|uniref:ERC protein 2 n=1 Tax=Etheostoma spectabile TaxID=54343 RepID=UPI0013AEA2CF|nr:ERC protein 2-like [Etheostoma spectabile]